MTFSSLVWLGAMGFNRRSFRVVSYFDESVQGLDVGSPVKFRGVPIGSVARIGIGPDRRHVEVTSEVDLNAMVRLGLQEDSMELLEQGVIPPDLRVQLVSLGITGLKFLEVDIFGADHLETEELPFKPPWNHLPSTESTLKSVEVAITEALNRFPELEEHVTIALIEASAALAAVRNFVDPNAGGGGLAKLVMRLEGAATSLELAASSLDSALRQADVGGTMASIRDAADSVSGAAHEATGVGVDLRNDLVMLRETLQSVRTLADTLEHDPGALLRGRGPAAKPPGRSP